MSCTLFELDESYIKESAPMQEKSELYSTNITSLFQKRDRAEIEVNVDILSILEIAEVDGFLSLQLNLKLSWFDGRLTFLNLKDEQDLNTLSVEVRNTMWIPQIVFHNTESKRESISDDQAFATIKRNGDYTLRPLSVLHNAHLFRGDENAITISRVYSEKFLCEFDMRVYPFDTQNCSVQLIMKGNSGKFARLISRELKYLGPIDLTLYYVKETDMNNVIIYPDIEAVRVEVIFGRRLLSTMLTIFLPTFLICLVSFSTTYFKLFFFEAMVTVNLTSLLVLCTLFISVSESLPETAQIKMIDIWLIFCLIIPFMEVILQVLTAY